MNAKCTQREQQAAQQAQVSMETKIGYLVREIMDDIRHNVVKYPWFDQSTTGNLTDAMYRLEALDRNHDKDNAAEITPPEPESTRNPCIEDREIEMGGREPLIKK